jgi:hypothetical protein
MDSLIGASASDNPMIDRSAPLGPSAHWLPPAHPAAGSSGKPSTRWLHCSRFLSAPSAFMICWARELVVDRTVLLYTPLLRERVGEWLGPVHIFADQNELWSTAKQIVGREQRRPEVRIFSAGGLTYCPGVGTDR